MLDSINGERCWNPLARRSWCPLDVTVGKRSEKDRILRE
jgi:hypothetical protein